MLIKEKDGTNRPDTKYSYANRGHKESYMPNKYSTYGYKSGTRHDRIIWFDRFKAKFVHSFIDGVASLWYAH